MKVSFDAKTADNMGWVATTLILLAFALTGLGIAPATNFFVLMFNLVGAALFIAVGRIKQLTSMVTLNTVWGAVALIGLFRILVLHHH